MDFQKVADHLRSSTRRLAGRRTDHPRERRRAVAECRRAIELRGDLRLRALEDDDLRPLWDAL